MKGVSLHHHTTFSYMENHRRVYAERGSAKEQTCVDCGEQAQEWSQRHDADGSEPSDYEPRCCSCHQKYDNHWSEETRAKVSDSVKKTWADNPQRRTFSEEHRANLRAAWERRKARTEGGEA